MEDIQDVYEEVHKAVQEKTRALRTAMNESQILYQNYWFALNGVSRSEDEAHELLRINDSVQEIHRRYLDYLNAVSRAENDLALAVANANEAGDEEALR